MKWFLKKIGRQKWTFQNGIEILPNVDKVNEIVSICNYFEINVQEGCPSLINLDYVYQV